MDYVVINNELYRVDKNNLVLQNNENHYYFLSTHKKLIKALHHPIMKINTKNFSLCTLYFELDIFDGKYPAIIEKYLSLDTHTLECDGVTDTDQESMTTNANTTHKVNKLSINPRTICIILNYLLYPRRYKLVYADTEFIFSKDPIAQIRHLSVPDKYLLLTRNNNLYYVSNFTTITTIDQFVTDFSTTNNKCCYLKIIVDGAALNWETHEISFRLENNEIICYRSVAHYVQSNYFASSTTKNYSIIYDPIDKIDILVGLNNDSQPHLSLVPGTDVIILSGEYKLYYSEKNKIIFTIYREKNPYLSHQHKSSQ